MSGARQLDLLRRREFRLVFGAAAVSMIGDAVVPIALTFAVLDTTGSATDLGIVLAAQTAALLGSLLLGGVVADRLGPRTVMIGADLVRLLAQASIGLLVMSGHLDVLAIAAPQAVVGAATGFFNPAASGLIPAVAGARLQQANALREVVTAGAGIAGPALGGLLVISVGPGAALLIDAASYGLSALLLTRLAGSRRDRAVDSRRLIDDLRDGFAEVRARTWAWAIIVAASFVNTLGVAFWVLGAMVARAHYGGPKAWAAILAARAIGLLLGASILLHPAPRQPLLVAVPACATTALPLLLLATPARLPLILAAAAVAGLGAVVFNVLWETTLQQHVPSHARSRVSSYDWFGSLAFQPLGYALIGPLAAHLGLALSLYLCGGLQLVALSALMAVTDVRTLDAVGPRPAAQ